MRLRVFFPRTVLPVFTLLWVLSQSSFADTLWRVVYNDDPFLKRVGQEKLEEAYGAKIYVIPPSGIPPKQPVILDGIVIHVDLESDRQWVLGTKNPQIELDKTFREMTRDFPDVTNIEEKWSEINFLREIAPGVGAPETHLGKDFAVSDKTIQDEVRKRVLDAMERYGVTDSSLYDRLFLLETIRSNVQGAMGKSIAKVRNLSHSEGRLPKTSENWIEIYLNYLKHTKPEVERLHKATQETSESLASKIVSLPYIEGRVLDFLVHQPEPVIFQKMLKIQRELRVHVVEGRVLKGASFLRFYPLNGYVPMEEIDTVENELESQMLQRLRSTKFHGGKYGRLSFTSDFIIEEGAGPLRARLKNIDLNAGIDSGYYYPEEDLFTTHLLAQHFTGKRTPLLLQFDEFARLPIGPVKVQRLRAFLDHYAPFITQEVAEATWDRVIANYRRLFAQEPSSQNFDRILKDLHSAGLKIPSIYFQLINEIQDQYPRIRLSPERQRLWARYLEGLDKGSVHSVSILTDGKLRALSPAEAKKSVPSPAVSCTLETIVKLK